MLVIVRNVTLNFGYRKEVVIVIGYLRDEVKGGLLVGVKGGLPPLTEQGVNLLAVRD
jgi:hypothetical protein